MSTVTRDTTRRPFVPPEVDVLDPYVDAGVFTAAEVQFASLLARRQPGTEPHVLLAAALAARAPRVGHVCVDLADVTATTADAPEPDLLPPDPWPAVDGWVDALRRSTLVTLDAPTAVSDDLAPIAPLVLVGTRLTLDRYARYEARLAATLRARAASPAAGRIPAAEVPALLDRFFPPANPLDPADPAGPDRQRQAAELALTRGIVVLAGGPGTGKTRTIARFLAASQDAAVAQGRPLQVALCAPTGKAAARMAEAVEHEIGQLDLPEAVTDRLRATPASTIHRLLGHADFIRFRHNAAEPLPHDLVIVDETSMASLPLMARLVDAVRADATLVLVGDPFQLASVEAGAVLGSLTEAADSPGSPLAPVTITLTRVHRFGAGSAIARVAEAIRTGDADLVLDLLTDPAETDTVLVDPAATGARAAVEHQLTEAADLLVGAAIDGDPEAALDAARSIKLLAATHRGPNSVADWQQRIELALERQRPGLDTRLRWYVGRPVMVTRNDPLTGVFNGDTGILIATPDGPRVTLGGPDGGRLLEPGRLEDLVTWWAMTIHKSQGSEFDHAVIALPDAGSPILSRELLYTAVTRAKRQVTIVATPEAVRAAVHHAATRASGLAQLLISSPAGAAHP